MLTEISLTFTLTLKTICSSIFRPAFPGYLPATLAGVRSNMLAPVSVHIACTSVFFPVPLGPVIITDLTCGAFSCAAWEPRKENYIMIVCLYVHVHV